MMVLEFWNLQSLKFVRLQSLGMKPICIYQWFDVFGEKLMEALWKHLLMLQLLRLTLNFYAIVFFLLIIF